MKTILMTGGAGFIGSHTADLLLKNDCRVIVYDNLSSGKVTQLDLLHPNMEFIQADILDYPTLAKHVAKCDAVLHLAALSSVPQSIKDPVNSLKVNTQGFLHVLQAIQAAAKPIRLVFASSAAVYGDCDQLPCDDEKVELSRVVLSPYALEKINNESYAQLYFKLYGIHSLALRYFNVYGERQDPNSPYSGVISKFMKNYASDEPIAIFGDGAQSRDFISVEDIARANLLALHSEFTGALNIASGQPETVNQLVDYIQTVGGKPAKIEHVDSRMGEISQSFGRTDRAAQYLKFKFTLSLADGIKRLMSINTIGEPSK
jgi:UDP-glucose 4-epimerase